MPGPIVYVPSRVGEGYFTDWQAPVAGDNGKVWAYNHGTGKFEPYTIPSTSPGGSTTQVQYNSSGAFAGHSGFTYNGSGVATLSAALVVPIVRPAADSTSAWKVTKADGTTSVFVVDTTNSRNLTAIGSAANPGIAFIGFTNTGIYHDGNAGDGIWLTAQGVGAFNVRSSAIYCLRSLFVSPSNTYTLGDPLAFFSQGNMARILTLAGSVGNPAFNMQDGAANNYNTGLYAPSSSTLGIVVSASEKIRVQSDGNVGIGTTSPSQKLDVNGSVNVATALIVPVVRPASDSTTAWKVTKADGTTAVVTVDTTGGAVGINTTSIFAPYKFHVVGGTVNELSGTGVNNAWRINLTQANVDGLGGFWMHYTNTAVAPDFFGQAGFCFSGGASDPFKQFQVYVADSITPKVVVNGNGQVGILTTSPTAYMDLPASTTARASLRIRNTANAPTSPNAGDIWYPTGGRLSLYRAATEIFATGVQATGGSATAGASYTSAEQSMIQKAYDACRAFGLLS